MSNPNDPAYPTFDEYTGARKTLGLTIRQEFVKAAMMGLCASQEWMGADDVTMLDIESGIAIHACRLADATLAEEARTRKP